VTEEYRRPDLPNSGLANPNIHALICMSLTAVKMPVRLSVRDEDTPNAD
jgi:hypothetical protein